jgi:hypothetical protein
VDERALEEVRRLAAIDAELAARTDGLRELGDEVEAIRARAEAGEAFFANYPEAEARRRAATAEARQGRARREAELAAAHGELGAARKDEERASAERAVRRAEDRLAVAEARVARAAEAESDLEQEAAALTAEIPGLETRAAVVSSRLPDLPPAPSGPHELVEWASRARATLFVIARQLDAQRDRVIREANELGSMLLGEPLYGSTTAQVERRIAATIGRPPS